MVKISRSLWLSSTVLFLFIISETPAQIAIADNDNTRASKFVDCALSIDAENLVGLFQPMQDFELIDSRLSEDYLPVIE
ncbi:MAG: hypothetical protein IIB69_08500 [Proteobacteria bacterium]|nr:hypothetical protein [Pseudomonadota bacterium]